MVRGRAGKARIAIALALVMSCAALLAGGASAEPDRADGQGLNRLDAGMCQVVDFPGISQAAEWLAERLGRNNVKGGAIGTFVVSSIQAYCNIPNHLQYATRAVGFLFNKQKPSTVATATSYRNLYAQQQAAQVASQLRSLTNRAWTAGAVRSLVGRICRDSRQNADPIGRDLAPSLPGATLSALSAVNGIIGATLRCKPALAAADADYLSGGAFNYLVANTYPDLEPPSTFFTQISQVRYTDHLTRVSFWWLAFDRGGRVTGLSVYKRVNYGPWRFDGSLHPSPASATTKVPEGSAYQLALQAIDSSGNRSAWAYTTVGTA